MSTLAATQIFEYNASCIVFVYQEGMKARTKQISLKWHHFRDQLKSRAIQIVKVDTNHNWTDILTKPLSKAKHEWLHHFIMGW